MRFSGSVLFTDIFIGLHVFQSLSFVHIVRYFGTDSLYMHIHLGFSVSIFENTARYILRSQSYNIQRDRPVSSIRCSLGYSDP